MCVPLLACDASTGGVTESDGSGRDAAGNMLQSSVRDVPDDGDLNSDAGCDGKLMTAEEQSSVSGGDAVGRSNGEEAVRRTDSEASPTADDDDAVGPKAEDDDVGPKPDDDAVGPKPDDDAVGPKPDVIPKPDNDAVDPKPDVIPKPDDDAVGPKVDEVGPKQGEEASISGGDDAATGVI